MKPIQNIIDLRIIFILNSISYIMDLYFMGLCIISIINKWNIRVFSLISCKEMVGIKYFILIFTFT